MQLIINGEKIEFKEGITISEILKELKIEEKAMAVAVNMEIVKTINGSNYLLKVEIK